MSEPRAAENGRGERQPVAEEGEGSPEGSARAQRARLFPSWRLAGAIAFSAALTFALLPPLAERLASFEVAAAAGLLPLDLPVGEGTSPRFADAPLVLEPCRCTTAADAPGAAALSGFLASYPPSETAVLTGAGSAMGGGSLHRLAHHLRGYRVYGVGTDPAGPLGYRFHGDGARGDALPLPERARTLVVADRSVVGLLDPRTLRGTRHRLADGSEVWTVPLHERPELQLTRDGDRTYIAAARVPRTPEDPPIPVLVRGATMLSQITGPGSPNDPVRWDFFGTDLGSPFWHRGHLHMLFGDTFGEGSRWQGTNWRSNAMARLEAPGPAPTELRFESMVSGLHGWAREVLPSRKIDGIEMTVLPTSGVSVGDRMFMHYKSVERWIVSGQWVVGHSGMAYSDDDGLTWKRPTSATWPGGIGFEQAALLRHEGHVYSFGLEGGRLGPVRLRRVAEDRVLDASAYEYWDGSAWTPEQERATPIVPAPAGQLSVAWNPRFRLWMMLYLKPDVDAIVLRLSPRLTGPWSEPQFVVRGRDEPGPYAPYIVPLPDTGEDVWFAMSKWWPYNVFLMKMTLGEGTLVTARDEAR